MSSTSWVFGEALGADGLQALTLLDRAGANTAALATAMETAIRNLPQVHVLAADQLNAWKKQVVLCEHEFAQEGYTGQNLLDDLRRNQLLPFYTVAILLLYGIAGLFVNLDNVEHLNLGFAIIPFDAIAERQAAIEWPIAIARRAARLRTSLA